MSYFGSNFTVNRLFFNADHCGSLASPAMKFNYFKLLAIVVALLGINFGQAEGQIEFVEVSEEVGILTNSVDFGFGGGVAAFDYDEDGDIDLYLPQRFNSPDRFYQNDGSGNFSDVADLSGIDIEIAGRSALWFDFDDDRLVDLLVASDCFNSPDPDCTTKTSLRLYRQIVEGQFEDVTQEVGLDDAGIAVFFGHRAGMCCGDIDRDGDLDLLVGQWEGELELFINNSGTFVNETLKRGILNPNAPFPFNPWQSVMCDFNGDGWLDIFTAVDFFENQLWMNQGDGTFVDVAVSAGVDTAFNEMGVTIGDYDQDGDFDLFVTNIFEDDKHNLLLRNDSSIDTIQFTEVSAMAGVDDAQFGWGCSFFDANNDTVLDLAVTNGWFNGIGIDDTSRMFMGSVDIPGTFQDVSTASSFNDNFFGSCLVAADLNRDGDLDLMQVCNPSALPGPFRVLENQLDEQGSSANWLAVQPRQSDKNHWAIGAIVAVEFGDKSLVRLIGAGTSMHGQEPAEAFFGLGDCEMVDRVIVKWPLGETSVWEDVPAGQVFSANDADFNLDGDVNILDIFAFRNSLGQSGEMQADLNHDGIVDLADAVLFVEELVN